MSSVTPAVGEITPAQFEDELRNRQDVVVVDTREAESFAVWRVDGVDEVLNIPEAALTADPEAGVSAIPSGARVRVICHSGVGSFRAAQLLAGRFPEVLNVEGGMIGWSRVLQSADVPLDGPFRVVQFRREARGCLSYLVVAGDEALVVDPAPDVQPYIDEAARRGVTITRVFDTHVHADHVSGGRELADATGATLHLSEVSVVRGLQYARPVDTVTDGDVLGLGGESVRVVALPGHTTDMTGLLLGESALVGGDSLFVDSVARPDLEAGSENADEAARDLFATLREKVAPLPDTTVLLPCHYPGGRLDAALVATLGDVRRRVDELSLDREAFVARVLAQLPPTPTNHLSIISVNLGEDLPADDVARLEVGANKCAARMDWDR